MIEDWSQIQSVLTNLLFVTCLKLEIMSSDQSAKIPNNDELSPCYLFQINPFNHFSFPYTLLICNIFTWCHINSPVSLLMYLIQSHTYMRLCLASFSCLILQYPPIIFLYNTSVWYQILFVVDLHQFVVGLHLFLGHLIVDYCQLSGTSLNLYVPFNILPYVSMLCLVQN